mgnify:CR=1 FL=1
MASSSSSSGFVEEPRVVDLSQASRGVWLVKMPLFLADKINNISEGESLGTVRIEDGRSISVQFSEALVGEFPRDHILVEQQMDETRPLMVLSHDEDNHSALEGTVVMKADMRPKVMDARYLALIKQRRQQQLAAVPKVKTITSSVASADAATLVEEYQRSKSAADSKREIMNDNDLLMVLFQMFEKKPRWTLKEILHRTGQPVQTVKKSLTKIASYHRSGDFRSYWELKPTYQKKMSKLT